MTASGWRQHVCAAACALLAGVAAAPAGAASCSLSVGALNFGAYDVFAGGDLAANADVVVSCRRVAGDPVPVLVGYEVALSTGSAGSYVQRRMQSGVNGLGYNLYTSNNYSQVWGNGSGSTRTVSGLFLFGSSTAPSTRRHTMYGRVPARQDVAVGTYADNVLVTVTY